MRETRANTSVAGVLPGRTVAALVLAIGLASADASAQAVSDVVTKLHHPVELFDEGGRSLGMASDDDFALPAVIQGFGDDGRITVRSRRGLVRVDEFAVTVKRDHAVSPAELTGCSDPNVAMGGGAKCAK